MDPLQGGQAPDRAQSLQTFRSYVPRIYLPRFGPLFTPESLTVPYSSVSVSSSAVSSSASTSLSPSPYSTYYAHSLGSEIPEYHSQPQQQQQQHVWSSMPGFGGRIITNTMESIVSTMASQLSQPSVSFSSAVTSPHHTLISTTQLAASAAYQPAHAHAYSLLLENRQLREQLKDTVLQLRGCEARLREAQHEHELVMRERASVHNEISRCESEISALKVEKESYLFRVQQLEREMALINSGNNENACDQVEYTVRVRMTRESLMNVAWKYHSCESSSGEDMCIIRVDYFITNESQQQRHSLPLRPGDRLLSLNGITLEHSNKTFFYQLIQSTQSKCIIELLINREAWPCDVVLSSMSSSSRESLATSCSDVTMSSAIQLVPILSWHAVKGSEEKGDSSLLSELENGDELLMVDMDDASSYNNVELIMNALREAKQIVVRRGTNPNSKWNHKRLRQSFKRFSINDDRVTSTNATSTKSMNCKYSDPSSRPLSDDLHQEEHAVLGALDSILHDYTYHQKCVEASAVSVDNPNINSSYSDECNSPSSGNGLTSSQQPVSTCNNPLISRNTGSAFSSPSGRGYPALSELEHPKAHSTFPSQRDSCGIVMRKTDSFYRASATLEPVVPHLLWRTGITAPSIASDNTSQRHSACSNPETASDSHDENEALERNKRFLAHLRYSPTSTAASRRSRHPLSGNNYFIAQRLHEDNSMRIRDQEHMSVTEEEGSIDSNSCTPVMTPSNEAIEISHSLRDRDPSREFFTMRSLESFPPPLPPRSHATTQEDDITTQSNVVEQKSVEPKVLLSEGEHGALFPRVVESTPLLNTTLFLPLPDVAAISQSAERSQPSSSISSAHTSSEGLSVSESPTASKNPACTQVSKGGLMTAFIMQRTRSHIPSSRTYENDIKEDDRLVEEDEEEETGSSLRSSILTSETTDSGLELTTSSSGTVSRLENVFSASPNESILLQTGSPRNKSGSRVSFANFIPSRIRKRIPKVGKSRIVKLPYSILMNCLENSIVEKAIQLSASQPPLTFQLSSGVIFITFVESDSVADVRGLLEGDQLLAVNSISVLNITSLSQLKEKLIAEHEELLNCENQQSQQSSQSGSTLSSSLCKLRVQFNPLKLRFSSSAESVSSSDENWRTRMVQSSSSATTPRTIQLDSFTLPHKSSSCPEEDEHEESCVDDDVVDEMEVKAACEELQKQIEKNARQSSFSNKNMSLPTHLRDKTGAFAPASVSSNIGDTVRAIFMTGEQYKMLLNELKLVGGSRSGIFIKQIPLSWQKQSNTNATSSSSSQSVRHPDVRIGDKILQVNKRSFSSMIGEMAFRELRHLTRFVEAGSQPLICLTLQNNMKEFEKVLSLPFPLNVPAHLVASNSTFIDEESSKKSSNSNISRARPIDSWDHFYVRVLFQFNEQNNSLDPSHVNGHANTTSNGGDNGANRKKVQRSKVNTSTSPSASSQHLTPSSSLENGFKFQSQLHHLSVQLYDLIYVDATLDVLDSENEEKSNHTVIPQYWHAWKVDRWGRKMQTGLLPSIHTLVQLRFVPNTPPPLLKDVSHANTQLPQSSEVLQRRSTSNLPSGGSLRLTATNSFIHSSISTATGGTEINAPSSSPTSRAVKCKSAVILEEDNTNFLVSPPPSSTSTSSIDACAKSSDDASMRFRSMLHHSFSTSVPFGQHSDMAVKTQRRSIGNTNDCYVLNTNLSEIVTKSREGAENISAHSSNTTLPTSSGSSASPNHRNNALWLVSSRRWMAATLSRKSSSGSSSTNSSMRDKHQQSKIISNHSTPLKTCSPSSGTIKRLEDEATQNVGSFGYLPMKPVFPSKESSLLSSKEDDNARTVNTYSARPVLLVGPLSNAVARYVSEHLPQRFHFSSSLLTQNDGVATSSTTTDVINGIIQYVTDLNQTQPKLHGILVECFQLLECLHKRRIYPIVVQIHFKTTKQLKELHRKLELPGKIKKKVAKRLLQESLTYENWPYYITVNLQYENLSSLLEKMAHEVDSEQKFDLLWINCEEELKLF